MRGGDIDWTAVGGFAAMTASFAWGLISNIRLARHKKKQTDQAIEHSNADLAKAQEALLETTQQDRDAWRQRFETEHSEFNVYRNRAHEQVNKAQELVLKLSAENAELKVKTDLTPVLKAQEDQGKMMLQMADAMKQITNATAKILDRMDIAKT